ncbi:MAG: hypothetical protein K4305_09050 [Chlorobium sp.]|uniref:hypothetical protein n=1 Tax=Chlorobium sp. TaxID=1095 RepID=UPI002F418FFD
MPYQPAGSYHERRHTGHDRAGLRYTQPKKKPTGYHGKSCPENAEIDNLAETM